MLLARLRHDDGNQITKTVKASGKQWRYTYDAFDRLTRAALFPTTAGTTAESQVDYSYDALNRRIRREEARPSNQVFIENYFHDGWDIDSADEVSGFVFSPTVSRRVWFTMGETDDLALSCSPSARHHDGVEPRGCLVGI